MTRIGIVAERPGEARVAGTPATVAKLRALGYEVVVETGAGAASAFPDDAFAEAGALVVARAEAWHADVVLKVNAPTPGEVALLADGATLIGAAEPRAAPRRARVARRPRHHGARAGRGAAHLARAVDGRAQLDGEHLRLPRGHRGGARVRPVLHRAGHRGGQGAAREGARRGCRRRRPRRDRRGLEPRRDRARDRPAARGRRPGAVDRRRVPRRSRSPRSMQSTDGYAKATSEAYDRRAAEIYSEQAARRRHHHHDRADPRAARRPG